MTNLYPHHEPHFRVPEYTEATGLSTCVVEEFAEELKGKLRVLALQEIRSWFGNTITPAQIAHSDDVMSDYIDQGIQQLPFWAEARKSEGSYTMTALTSMLTKLGETGSL